MPKVIRFISLELVNFTSHRSRAVQYGDITRLSGKNGEGKSSIGAAPIWVLYGTDLYGSKFDPSPTTYEFDRVYASLTLLIDGSEYRFARELPKGKTAVYYVNEVPTKAKEFESAVEALLPKDEFLSLYHPAYFFGLHWTKQREQVMRYAPEPLQGTVFSEMSRTDPGQKAKDIPLNSAAAKLAELVKKHTLVDLQQIHGGTNGRKSKLDKQYIAAQSKTRTLQEQLLRVPPAPTNVVLAEKRLADIEAAIKDNSVSPLPALRSKIDQLQSEYVRYATQYQDAKEQHTTVSAKKPDDTCTACGQALEDETREAAQAAHAAELKTIAAKGNEALQKAKELRAQVKEAQLGLTAAEAEESEKPDLSALYAERDALKEQLQAHKQRDDLNQQVAAAKAAEEQTLTDLRESTFILDAIKSYRAKEAELQAEQVQSLFTTLSIRLFKFVKTTGEYEPDFSIQMNGKDYVKLSTGERVTAQLELINVLYKQSELVTPTFLDCIGEYTGKVAVYGQLITGRAVLDQDLLIETTMQEGDKDGR
ncbi:ATPase [Paenibacillus sp. GYB004]|uniref:ATPase n=1 Tax=Paenibacillus sp. GYB004 TaxID=2994393 RepID=UPI002F96A2BE